MKKQVIKLLHQQIDQLEQPEFDLEAWKSATMTILERIFGTSNEKLKLIGQLKIDYSSWALRDSNAKYKPVESCKNQGKAILKASIDEIETFGLPLENPKSILEKYLDGAEVKTLLSNAGNKAKVLSGLKKKDLEKLVLNLLELSTS